jgi:uncharacterized caspase-like protein
MVAFVKTIFRSILPAVGLLYATLLHAAPLQPALERTNGGARVALVIGNGAYQISPLKNPVNDARAMSGALKQLGFDVVLQENAGLDAMVGAIRTFSLKAKESEVRLFYYAGHGVQVKGKNYLIPVDADIQGEDEIPAKSADVTEVLERLGQLRTGLNIVILDACRNNPFATVGFVGPDGRLVRFRGVATPRPGLAQVEAPAGTLVAFATSPGAIALDGGNLPNSLYTKHLLANIATPGLPVEQMFKRVRVGVAQETNRQQVPWESSSLMGDFCFRTQPGGKCLVSDENLLVDPVKLAPK